MRMLLGMNRLVGVKMPPGLIRLVGRRGACLLALGILDVVIGWSVWIAPQSPLTLFRHIPSWVLGLSWIFAGVVALISIRRKQQDSWGFIGAWAVPFIWGSLFVAEMCAPSDILGVWAGIRAVVTYWGYAALVMVISGWPEGQIVITPDGQIHGTAEGPDHVDLGDSSY